MSSNYFYHCENLKMIDKAIQTLQRTLRQYIAIDDEKNVYIYTKILSHLINSWVDVRILKLIYEFNAFNESEINSLISCKILKDKWLLALDFAFIKAYKISNIKNIDNPTVPYTARIMRKSLVDIISDDLLESTQVRNRIAHGQWKYAFNNELTKINENIMRILKEENIIKLQLKLKMFKSLSQIIHDLAVSKPTFERDFDNNYRIIEEQKRNFHNRRYDDYKYKMIQKKQKGLRLRSRAHVD